MINLEFVGGEIFTWSKREVFLWQLGWFRLLQNSVSAILIVAGKYYLINRSKHWHYIYKWGLCLHLFQYIKKPFERWKYVNLKIHFQLILPSTLTPKLRIYIRADMIKAVNMQPVNMKSSGRTISIDLEANYRLVSTLKFSCVIRPLNHGFKMLIFNIIQNI